VIDTHTHIVPGADDGARDLAQSLGLARAAVRSGVTGAIAVVHALGPDHLPRDAACERLGALMEELRARDIELDLTLAYEVDALWAEELDVEEMRGLAVGGEGRVLILETPHVAWPRRMEDLVFRLRVRGMVPVLAHPERNPYVQTHPEVLSALVSQGAVVQLTAPSILGAFGRAAQQTALRHLMRGDVALLASDAHYARREKADLLAAVRRLSALLPGVAISRLVTENATCVLAGREPQSLPRVGAGGRLSARLRGLFS
jgi:protein-tyrosine phosphatase